MADVGLGLLSCMFWDNVPCEFRESENFLVMDKCLSCSHYKRFNDGMERFEDKFFVEADKAKPVSSSKRARAFRGDLRANPHTVEPLPEGSFLNVRLRLNHQILDNAYWYLSVDDKGHENYVPVGRDLHNSGSQCGKWVSDSVCGNIEGHDGFYFHGEDWTGKMGVRQNHWWCNKSSCPTCFAHGWATRRGRVLAGRIVEGEKRGFGKGEHVIVSPSVADRCFQEDVLRPLCRKALLDRCISGGAMIFHGYRIDRVRHCLVWKPHFHCIGFVKGGYACRSCEHLKHTYQRSYCDAPEGSCNGFEYLTRELNKVDGCIVKVEDERKTIMGTAFYQLHHATVRLGVKRFHVVTWFGVCGNRKYKSEPLKVEAKCPAPACGGKMTKALYVGKRSIVRYVGNAKYKSVFAMDKFDGNEANFIDFVGRKDE